MTNQERFETALVRIRAGEAIETIVNSTFRNWRYYKKHYSEAQRAEIRAARWQYMASRGNKTKPGRKRIIVTVTQERDAEVSAYCQAHKITVSRFVNRAISEALQKAKG